MLSPGVFVPRHPVKNTTTARTAAVEIAALGCFTRQFTLGVSSPVPLARSIADALRRGATIVAANPRAARVLQLRFAEDQRAASHTIWPSPAMLDWDSWLRGLWRDHAFFASNAPILLTPLQESALWTRILRNDDTPFVSRASIAALAMEAWYLLSAFNAHSARRGSWGSGQDQSDAERFRLWADEFERTCLSHGWLSSSQLESALTPLAEDAQHIGFPEEILLVGFDRTTPAQESFLAALRSRGMGIAGFHPEAAIQPPQRSWLAATHLREEIAACAAWARDLLLANPAASIAVLVSSIDATRGPMDRTFRRVLLPATEDIRRPFSPLPWEFSLGQPLADIPAIRSALLLLQWIGRPLHEEEISWLLLSGFVADTVTNNPPLATHDARQRRYGLLSPERSLVSYRDSLAAQPALRTLHHHLSALLRVAENNKLLAGSRPASAWSELVPLLLDSVAWPGERSPDSVQFQALQRWQRLLDEIALLDFDGSRYSYADFVTLLESHARESIFSAESHDAPIRIMGPFESSGQQFDAIWFLGTDDAAWPRHGRLHPLLPAAIQRQFSMPHATPDDDWNLAQIVTTRLLNSAPHIVFSCAERDKDTELRPSPLIATLFPAGERPQTTATLAPAPPPLPVVSLETIADDSGVLPWPQEQNAGGSEVLKRQAACPFQAFAAKRLRAQPIDETDWGISPSEKGRLLHRVMERLFSPSGPASLHNREEIVTALATKRIPAILENHIDEAFRAEFGSALTDPWQQACLAAEKRRLLNLLESWLTLEAGRQPFTVEACEKRLEGVHVGDLRLNLRADRIDLLEDGSRLLIDYKTGQISTSSWQGDRPEDPQLPLYAAYGNVENLSGIVMAKIRAGENDFEGRVRDARAQLSTSIGAKESIVKDPYSPSMRDEWAEALEKLAQEFLRGDAAVDPRPRACDLCHFQSLCRVAEHNLVTAGSAQAEEAIDD